MDHLWQLVRIPLIFTILFGIPLILVFRSMARQVRQDYQLGRVRRTRAYEDLAIRFAAIALCIVVFAVAEQEWMLLGLAAFAIAIPVTIWLNKARAEERRKADAELRISSRVQVSDGYSWVARHPKLTVAIIFVILGAAAVSFLYEVLDRLVHGRWAAAFGGCVALLISVASAYKRQRSRSLVETKP